MAETVAAQAGRYPVMVFHYRVSVGSVDMSFSEVSGLKREYEHVTYRHGLSFLEGESITRFHIDRYQSITMKRGVVRGVSALRDWLADKGELGVGLVDNPIPVAKLGTGSELLKRTIERPITIRMYDGLSKQFPDRNPVATWTVAKAIPVKLEAPSFEAKTAEAAIETLEVMASGITVEYHEV